VNWGGLFETTQNLLVEEILENEFSKYHARAIRVFKANGFLEEKEIIKFCLMTVRDTRMILN